MASDGDFTFCQVGLPAEVDDLKDSKSVIDISSISLNDKFSSDGIVKREETVGSLSFSVIDTTARQKLNESPRKAVSKSNLTSVSGSQQKAPSKSSLPRAKVPFEIGCSPMDWLKLTRTHPDLAVLKGQSNRRIISMEEVKQHQTGNAMWTVFKGRVYNIAPYMKFHPGGVDMLMKAVGKDCTSLFNKYHAWVNAEALLDKCLVGTLETR